ncbi:serine protease [Actinoallomurus sp. NPDC052308]|uniref:S1 family peptidase n=1 Tax=Actinoallomurus sp. NPDC052308 TaxID=3155530 RepID=UPI0034364E91
MTHGSGQEDEPSEVDGSAAHSDRAHDTSPGAGWSTRRLVFLFAALSSALVLLVAALGSVLWRQASARPSRPTGRPQAAAPTDSPADSFATSLVLEKVSVSILRIVGSAPKCRRPIAGTGFVYAPEHVLTTAHNVAGVRGGLDTIGEDGVRHRAIVTLYDPRRDLAVLDVPGLDAPALDFFQPIGFHDELAVVAGYVRNGTALSAEHARIRAELRAQGPDLYGNGRVTRGVYAIDAAVPQGVPGAPLLATDGDVYGMVFAANMADSMAGYALTAEELESSARTARTRTRPVSAGACVG